MKLRLGARGSALSLAQAGLVRRALAPLAEVEIVTVKTTGDRLSAEGVPIGWKGDFTREIDEALFADRVDFAVHSLKDVPSAIPPGLVLAAVPLREDPSDVLVSHPRLSFAELPSASRLGTSSPRRRAQLLAARPDLEVVEARGNVDTRVRRLREGKWDAIVLARAGLARLGRLEEVTEVLPESLLLPAPGQGALAIIARGDDARVLEILSALNDPGSRAEVAAERALLARLEAGCKAPIAALARCGENQVRLTGAVFSVDGAKALREIGEGPAREAARVGEEVAGRLLARGAAALIAESKE